MVNVLMRNVCINEILCRCVSNKLKTCMKKFYDEKIMVNKFTYI